ncbi:hypothetical protein FRC10_002392, partial [Ceratobasidium sp. 414]
MYSALALTSLYLAVVRAQQVGIQNAEVHPSLPWQKCTKSGGCASQPGKIVLDANWRWVHTTSGYTNCYSGQTWDATLCPDPVTCAKNCAVEGADYGNTYGISTSGNALTLKFVTSNTSGKNVGSRVYMMASDDTKYEMFKLKNQEFTFDVDVSNLPCGLNGALYFSEMSADGGMTQYPNNRAGAKYGTGYCDAQCPKDIKFINGEANSGGWAGSANDPNSGTGSYGTCCSEMDVWEANSIATAYTPHPCSVTGQTRCSGSECTSFCDQPGCDFNSFRMGDKSYYGKGFTVDTSKKMTVVTQFVTDTNTASGKLVEIRRLYVQNGKVIQNSKTNIPGMDTYDSVTDQFCSAQKTAFNDQNVYAAKGGMATMDKSFTNGVVLVMSIWDDHAANMLWLDSSYPVASNPSAPGITRGTCATTSGTPTDVETNSPNASVTFSNIRFGDIGSTYSGTTTNPITSTTSSGSTKTTTSSSSTKTTSTPPSTPTAPSGTVPRYGQCGGNGYTGPTLIGSILFSSSPRDSEIWTRIQLLAGDPPNQPARRVVIEPDLELRMATPANSPDIPFNAMVRSRRSSAAGSVNRLGSPLDDPPCCDSTPPEDPETSRYRLKLHVEVERERIATNDRDRERDYEIRKAELEIERLKAETSLTASKNTSTAVLVSPALPAAPPVSNGAETLSLARVRDLCSNELQGYLDGTQPVPPAANAEASARYRREANCLTAGISGLLDNSTFALVSHLGNMPKPKDLWDELERIFRNKDANQASLLLSELHGSRFSESDDPERWFARLRDLYTSLIDTKLAQSEATVCQIMIEALPSSYREVAISLQKEPDAKWTIANFSSLIRQHYTYIKRLNARSGTNPVDSVGAYA